MLSKLRRVPYSVSNTNLQTRLQATSASMEYDQAKRFGDIPGPRGLPILKNILDFIKPSNMKGFAKHHKSMINQYGNIYKLRMPGDDNIIFISTAEDARNLLSLDGQTPISQDFEPFETIRRGPLKDDYKVPGLVAQGKDWLEFRKAVQQDMMRPDSALFYIDDLADVMEQTIEKMEAHLNSNNEVTDINKILQEFALEAVGVMFIGTRLGTLKGSEEGKKLIELAVKIFDYMVFAIVVPQPVLNILPSYKQFIEDNRSLFNISKKLIKQAIEKHEIDGSLDGTIVGKLVDRCGKDSNIPVVMAVDAMFAGIDTTGNTAHFLLYHLASNPAKQENLYQEILQVIGSNGKMTKKKLSEMRYLKACQMESQRMLPVVSASGRRTQVDMVLGGYQVPKGTYVLRHGAIMGEMEKYYDNPEEFMPERWIRGSAEFKKVDAHANLPFGHGPRACVGQRFARLELYMLMFELIQKYKLEYNGPPITTESVDYTAIGKPACDIDIIMKKR